jgi:hypothetical protein
MSVTRTLGDLGPSTHAQIKSARDVDSTGRWDGISTVQEDTETPLPNGLKDNGEFRRGLEIFSLKFVLDLR